LTVKLVSVSCQSLIKPCTWPPLNCEYLINLAFLVRIENLNNILILKRAEDDENCVDAKEQQHSGAPRLQQRAELGGHERFDTATSLWHKTRVCSLVSRHNPQIEPHLTNL
jgi:hypothetical protein